MMSIEQPRNLSYLLRLYQVERNGELVWWASLENPRTGERQAFADLADLFAFLNEKTVNRSQPTGENDLCQSGEITFDPVPLLNNEQSKYLSYLLRLLWIDRESDSTWRISLQSPHAGERLGFKDLTAMMSYLEKKFREPND